MKKTIFKKPLNWLVMASIVLLSYSCNNDDGKGITPQSQGKEHYVLMTANLDAPGIPGYLSAFDKLPQGDINGIQKNALSLQGSGFKTYGKYVFQRISQARRSSSVTEGIQRYTLGENGQFVKDGFIAASKANFDIYDEHTGFYMDANKSIMKLQIFDPYTMERKGEIDLSQLKNDDFEYQSVGESLIACKEGKVYVNITCGSKEGKGSFFKDPALGYVDVAVIDINSKKYEKTIRNNNISYIGYPGNHNQMWCKGDDGGLYFCSHGFYPGGAKGSAIVRIKKGETDFDKDWIIKADDYTPGTSMGAVAVKNGKLYTAIGNEAINFKVIGTAAIYDYYEIDVNQPNVKGVKLSGFPSTKYAFQNGQGIVDINNTLYFNISNNNGMNAYYRLNKGKGEMVFNVTKGGRLFGFGKVTQ